MDQFISPTLTNYGAPDIAAAFLTYLAKTHCFILITKEAWGEAFSNINKTDGYAPRAIYGGGELNSIALAQIFFRYIKKIWV